MATITAQDGIAHAPSRDPDVHRPLIAVNPPLRGRDVANVQRATRERLAARGIGPDEVPVPDHGKFTLATALACVEAQYFLGLRSDTYLMKDTGGHLILTEGAQRILRDPDSRDDDQRARAKARAEQAERGPRYYEELAGSMGLAGHGIDAALAFAAAHVGVKETTTNSGPLIDKWCRLAGLEPPQLWCGCFVNACLVAGGLPSFKTWIASTPQTVTHAKKGIGGWSWHTSGRKGDLALYHDSSSDAIAVHVELVRAKVSNTTYSTYGGNTSSSSGSFANGGEVARHDDRSTTGVFHIIGFARPPWK